MRRTQRAKDCLIPGMKYTAVCIVVTSAGSLEWFSVFVGWKVLRQESVMKVLVGKINNSQQETKKVDKNRNHVREKSILERWEKPERRARWSPRCWRRRNTEWSKFTSSYRTAVKLVYYFRRSSQKAQLFYRPRPPICLQKEKTILSSRTTTLRGKATIYENMRTVDE